MKNKLFRNHIEIRKSSIQGYGVFATCDIKKGECIEECYVLLLEEKPLELANYIFTMSGDAENKNEKFALALGYGSLYNHSNNPNATFRNVLDQQLITFEAKQHINSGEEIFVSYGKDWFTSRNTKAILPPSKKRKIISAVMKLLLIFLVMLMFHLIQIPHIFSTKL